MRVITNLVSTAFNPTPIAKHFRQTHKMSLLFFKKIKLSNHAKLPLMVSTFVESWQYLWKSFEFWVLDSS